MSWARGSVYDIVLTSRTRQDLTGEDGDQTSCDDWIQAVRSLTTHLDPGPEKLLSGKTMSRKSQDLSGFPH